MAGFAVTFNGRSWVSAEAQTNCELTHDVFYRRSTVPAS